MVISKIVKIMRVVVDKWIVTTLKKGEKEEGSTSASDSSGTYLYSQDKGLVRRRRKQRRPENNNNDLVLEQRVSTEQQIFQDSDNNRKFSLNNSQNTCYNDVQEIKTFKKLDSQTFNEFKTIANKNAYSMPLKMATKVIFF